MKKFSRISKHFSLHVLLLFGVVFLTQCENELPEEGSIADSTPPTSGFSFRQDSEDQLLVVFTNEARSATVFEWDFGDGNTSTERNPTNVYEEFGTYTVSLTASDLLGISDIVILEIEVKEGPFQPIIFESSFEDLALLDENGNAFGDGRDSWRNNDLGGVIQITGSPVREGSGEQAAKLPGPETDERIGYQVVKVDTAQDYRLNFIYTLRDNLPGFVTVSILSGPVSTREEAAAATIGTFTGTNQRDPSEYTSGSITFNSGDSDEIVIFFFNNSSVEARLDDFSISPTVATVIPPTASFSFEPSEEDALEYTFINNSINSENFIWDFGDGTEGSEEENPTHKFPSIDTYTVTLVAESQFLTDTFRVDVVIPDPVAASFEYVQDPDNFLTISFTNTSQGVDTTDQDEVRVLWDFGDGFSSTVENPVYTYAEEKIYTVTLTATGVSGVTSVASMEVAVAEGFIVQVLNGTFDEFTFETGDNADAWDMTPNSTVVDNNGNTVDSPYRPLWRNTDLNDYIDATYCTNEQPATTGDGVAGTRGAKFSNSCRRLYQLVEVQPGVDYTFSIDTRSEVMGINTEVFILNTEITTEVGIDASKSDPAIDAYFEITNDFNDSDPPVFTTSSFTFTPSTNQIVIYVRALNAVDSSNEVFLDNVEITEN